MKARDTASQFNRREFFKRLPHHLLEKFGVAARAGASVFSSNAEEETRPRFLAAQIEVSRCHAWTGLLCQQCYLACPKRDQAIKMEDQKPVILAAICDGCAICVSACETVNDLPAVRMVASRPPVSTDRVTEKEVAL